MLNVIRYHTRIIIYPRLPIGRQACLSEDRPVCRRQVICVCLPQANNRVPLMLFFRVPLIFMFILTNIYTNNCGTLVQAASWIYLSGEYMVWDIVRTRIFNSLTLSEKVRQLYLCLAYSLQIGISFIYNFLPVQTAETASTIVNYSPVRRGELFIVNYFPSGFT